MTTETIVIPDIHNKTRLADRIVKRYADADQLRVIYLGDYFDDWGDGPAQARATAKWLHHALHVKQAYDALTFTEFKKRYPDQPYIVSEYLLGNHDMPYLYFDLRYPGGNRSAFNEISCSGWTEAKHHAVQEVIGYKKGAIALREQMQLHAVVGSWLITHAGVTSYWLDDEIDPTGAAVTNLLSAKRNIDAGLLDALVRAGRDRGGSQPIGGCTWCDWRSLKPTAGLNQLVGHTQDKTVRYNTKPRSKNICLDTRLRHYARYLTDTDDWEIIDV